jgi:hypothetical protein
VKYELLNESLSTFWKNVIHIEHGVMYLGEYDVCDVTLSVYKLFARCGYTLRVTSQTSYRIYILIHIYTYMQIIILVI